MHPIEHLRYLARADSADAAALVAETAVALGSLGAEHANLVVAARRIIERHPTVAPLWWLCAHLLVSDEARTCAWRLADELSDDPTADAFVEALPAGARIVTDGLDRSLANALGARPDLGTTCITSDRMVARAITRANRFGVDVDVVDVSDRSAVDAAVADADLVAVALLAGCPSQLLVSADGAFVAAVRGGTPLWLLAPLGTCLPSRYVDAIAEASPTATRLALPDVARVVTPAGVTTGVAGALTTTAPLAPELLRAVGAH